MEKKKLKARSFSSADFGNRKISEGRPDGNFSKLERTGGHGESIATNWEDISIFVSKAISPLVTI